ncbi:50S ribosomal L3 domain protein, partial [Chlamydia psittaci 01DC11]
HKKKKN